MQGLKDSNVLNNVNNISDSLKMQFYIGGMENMKMYYVYRKCYQILNL